MDANSRDASRAFTSLQLKRCEVALELVFTAVGVMCAGVKVCMFGKKSPTFSRETRLLLRHLMFGVLRVAKLEVIVSYLSCRRVETMKHHSRHWKRFVERSTRDVMLRVANATKTISQM
jgi:hypothetical protein